MGAFLPRPITTTKKETGEGNGLSWTVCSMQGWRVDMEDAHIHKSAMSDQLKGFSIFAVFDGHAGKNVAELSAAEFTNHLTKQSPFNTLKDDDEYKEDEIKNAIQEAFRSWDKELYARSHSHQSRVDRSGSTATGVIVTPEHFFFFNAGDSRTILIRNNEIAFHSLDHKPFNEEEKKRIEDAGGRVMIQRINGSLAVSRALGDFEYKNREDLADIQQLVSPMPDVTCIPRNKASDNYILVACDGIYDVMANEEIAEFCTDRLMSINDQSSVPGTLLDLCLHKGSRDNMSAIIVSLDKFPSVDPAKVQKDSELNDMIVDEIKAYLTSDNADRMGSSVDDFATHLQEHEFIKKCPSIGGIDVLLAKRGLITRHFEEARTNSSL